MRAGRVVSRRVALLAAVVALTLGGIGATAVALPGAGDADLSGFVTLNGIPEVGATVCVYDVDGGTCDLTDVDGSYSFDDLVAGSNELWVTPAAGSFGLAIGPSRPVPAIGLSLVTGANSRNVALTEGGRIGATVRHPGGALAVGTPITMCRTDSPGFGACPQIESVSTDANGEATSPNLIPGTYRVVIGFAISASEAPATLPAVVVSAGGTNDLGDVTLQVPGVLEGFVRNSSGQPIPGASVTIEANESTFGTSTNAAGHYSFPMVAPDTYSVSASILGLPYGTATESDVVVEENTTTEQDLVLPNVSFTGITGTSTRTVGGSYIFNGVVACPGGGTNVVGPACPGAVYTTTNGFGGFALALTPGVAYNVAPGFTNTFGFLELVGQEIPVTVAAGEALQCTFVTAALSTSSCVSTPTPPAGTLVLTVDEPSGFFSPGFCADPGLPQLGQLNCTDGRPATIYFSVPAGYTQTVTLSPGLYHSGMADQSVTVGAPITSFRIYDGLTTECSFKMSGATCSVNDGDGIDEPAGYDGNHDGEDDESQANVTSFVPDGGTEPVTIATTGVALADVSVESVPASPAPPSGADFPIGLVGFQVQLPNGATTADVELWLPAGTDVDRYYKLLGTGWEEFLDFDVDTAPTGEVVVTLHLTDGDQFDTVPGDTSVIGDPGGPARGPYGFSGFSSPVENLPSLNSAKAGQAIPVKWRLTNAFGVGVSKAASFVKLESVPSNCQTATGTPVVEQWAGNSGVQYLGGGSWQLNWKTPRSYKGCRELRLTLADGSVHTALFKFK